MKVLVCGGRTYSDYEKVSQVLGVIDHHEYTITEIIQGGAAGADALAKRWALENNVDCKEFKADWTKYGRGAGPIRNKTMLTVGQPTMVVAFPGSKGTANMIRQAKDAGIRVEEIS